MMKKNNEFQEKRPDERVRQKIGKMGLLVEPGDALVKEKEMGICKMLEGRDPNTKLAALKILSRWEPLTLIGLQQREAMNKRIIAIIRDEENPRLRRGAIYAFDKQRCCSDLADMALPVVVGALEDRDWDVKKAAIGYLEKHPYMDKVLGARAMRALEIIKFEAKLDENTDHSHLLYYADRLLKAIKIITLDSTISEVMRQVKINEGAVVDSELIKTVDKLIGQITRLTKQLVTDQQAR